MGVKTTLFEGRELKVTCIRFDTDPRVTVAPDPSSISITDKTADLGEGTVALHDILYTLISSVEVTTPGKFKNDSE
jgi:hypothetical protein